MLAQSGELQQLLHSANAAAKVRSMHCKDSGAWILRREEAPQFLSPASLLAFAQNMHGNQMLVRSTALSFFA